MRAKIGAALLTVGIALIALAPAANATKNNNDNGGSAIVGAVVIEGGVTVTSTKDLSRVTVVLCDGTVLVNPDAPGNEYFFEVDGTVRAVFVHSGNNTTAEAEALLELLGGKVSGNSTGAIALNDEDACDEVPPTTTTTTVPPTTTTTEPPVTTTTVPEVTTTTVPEVTVTTVPETPVTTVTAPPVTPTAPVTEVPEPVVPVTEVPVEVPAAPVAPVEVPVDELAFGGASSGLLAMYGAGMMLAGLGLTLMMRKNLVTN